VGRHSLFSGWLRAAQGRGARGLSPRRVGRARVPAPQPRAGWPIIHQRPSGSGDAAGRGLGSRDSVSRGAGAGRANPDARCAVSPQHSAAMGEGSSTGGFGMGAASWGSPVSSAARRSRLRVLGRETLQPGVRFERLVSGEAGEEPGWGPALAAPAGVGSPSAPGLPPFPAEPSPAEVFASLNTTISSSGMMGL